MNKRKSLAHIRTLLKARGREAPPPQKEWPSFELRTYGQIIHVASVIWLDHHRPGIGNNR